MYKLVCWGFYSVEYKKVLKGCSFHPRNALQKKKRLVERLLSNMLSTCAASLSKPPLQASRHDRIYAIVHCMNWIEERDAMSVINQAQPMTESNNTDLYNYLIALIKEVATTYLASENI